MFRKHNLLKCLSVNLHVSICITTGGGETSLVARIKFTQWEKNDATLMQR